MSVDKNKCQKLTLSSSLIPFLSPSILRSLISLTPQEGSLQRDKQERMFKNSVGDRTSQQNTQQNIYRFKLHKCTLQSVRISKGQKAFSL